MLNMSFFGFDGDSSSESSQELGQPAIPARSLNEIDNILNAFQNIMKLLEENDASKIETLWNDLYESNPLFFDGLDQIAFQNPINIERIPFIHLLLEQAYLVQNTALIHFLECRKITLVPSQARKIFAQAILNNNLNRAAEFLSKDEIKSEHALHFESFLLAHNNGNSALVTLIKDKYPLNYPTPWNESILNSLALLASLNYDITIASVINSVIINLANFIEKSTKLKEFTDNIEIVKIIQEIITNYQSFIDETEKLKVVSPSRMLIQPLMMVKLSLLIHADEKLHSNNQALTIFQDMTNLAQLYNERDRKAETAIDDLTTDEKGLFYRIKKMYQAQFELLTKRDDNFSSSQDDSSFDSTDLCSSSEESSQEEFSEELLEDLELLAKADDNFSSSPDDPSFNSSDLRLSSESSSQDESSIDNECFVSDQDSSKYSSEEQYFFSSQDSSANSGSPLQELTCYPVLKQMESYIIEQFEKNNLSMIYDESVAHLQPYYENIYHTAWRYIFCRPNVWTSPASKFSIANASHIGAKQFEQIAYFWLAASDANSPCHNDFTLESRIEFFIEGLASLGREYNRDDEDKLAQGDKPTCDLGVKKRLPQFLIAHPAVEISKELTLETYFQFFRAKFIAEHSEHPTLFSKLNTFSYAELVSFKAVCEKWIVNAGSEMNRIDKAILQLLDLNYDEDDNFGTYGDTDFIRELTGEFGEQQVKNTLTYQNVPFKNYKIFTHEVFGNPLKYFSSEIYQFLDHLIKEMEMKEHDNASSNDEKIASPVLNSFNSKKRKLRETQSSDSEESLEPKVKKTKFN